MSTVTLRIPDDKHTRLKSLAKARGISLNKLIDEMATMAITENDAYTRFQIRSSRGSAEEGLRLLDKVDSLTSGNSH